MLHNIDLNYVKNFTGSINELNIYLSNKNVTNLSRFGDDIWDFDTKPNKETTNFHTYYKKYDLTKPLITFWKLFIYIAIIKRNKKNKGQIVFVSNGVALIQYLNVIGFPKRNVVFTSQNANEFIDILQAKDSNPIYKTHQLGVLKEWHRLNKYLPNIFKLPSNPLQDINTDGIFSDNKNFKRGGKQDDESWIPLTIPQAMFLTRESIKWIENYADDIIKTYAQWKDYSGKYPKYTEYIAFGTKHIDTYGTSWAKTKKLADIVYTSIPRTLKPEHPLYSIWHFANQYTNKQISVKKLTTSIKQKDMSNALRSLYGACLVLILISTGMRKSELFSLQRGCIDLDTNPEIPLIESDVIKTNTGTSKLPISNIGAQAVNTLEQLAIILTGKEEGPLMFPVEKSKKNTELNKLANYDSHTFKMLHTLCKTLNYGEPPNLHAFRHTLAACVWERTDQAPVLLQMLYNHSSLSMTLHYLRSNPLIKQAQQELFTKKYLPLVREVIHSEKNKELGGNASNRVVGLVHYVKNDLVFQGKTEEELETAMEELFMTLIEQDQLRLFLTPFCICMRPNTSATKSPCMHIEDHGDSVYAKLPRTDRCVGSSCHDSLFTAHHKDNIHRCMTFYNESIEKVPEDLKSNIYFAKIVENESIKYTRIDKKLSVSGKGKKNA